MSEIKIGLIGGSGLGEMLRAKTQGERHEVDTPFGKPSDAIIQTQWEGGLPVYFLARHGPGHVLNPTEVPYRANIFALKKLGVTHIIASGAVGSLREEFRPRDLVIPDQIIDKTSKRANTFYEKAAVHVEFAEPFCPVLRGMIVEEGREGRGQGIGDRGQEEGNAKSHEVSGEGNKGEVLSSSSSLTPGLHPFTTHSRGCYVCMEGPAFSTRAESLMHRLWGGDLIGMTCMPEAKLAREAEIGYALVALVTDYDCWRKVQPPAPAAGQAAHEVDPGVLLAEIIANLKAASENAVSLIQRVLSRIAANPQALVASPAMSALQLGIWSDKIKIPREHVEQLAPLWIKYFQ